MKKQLLFAAVAWLLSTQYAQTQNMENVQWVILNFYQTDTNNATLQIQRNDSLLNTLHLSTKDSERTPIIIDQKKMGDCQISNLPPDTMALTINFLQESPINANLNIKVLAHTPLKFFNQRDDITRGQPNIIEKFSQPNLSTGLAGIKTDRSVAGLKKRRLASVVDGFRNGLAAYREDLNLLYGLIDKEGNIIQNAIYEQISPLNQYWSLGKDGKIALADSNGQLICQLKYENITPLGNNCVALFSSNDSVAIVNSKGAIVKRFAPNTTISTDTLNPNRFIIVQNGLNGLIDAQGNLVVPFMYWQMNWFSEKYLKVRKNGTWYGIIDTSGAVVVPIRYDDIYPPDTETTIDDHVFAVQQDKLWGLLRSDNTFLVPPRYTNMLMPRGKYWQCFDNQNHTTVLDSTGRMVLSLPYYLAWGFTPPRTQVILNDKYGCIDAQGKEIIPCISEQPICFYYVGSEDKVINTTNALIVVKGKYGIVDYNGNIVVPIIYDQILPQNADPMNSLLNYDVEYYAVSQNKKAGVVNAKGQVTIPLQYDAVSFACNNLVRLYASRDAKCGWATASGKIYAQPKLLTKPCQYYEQKALTYPTQEGCENAGGHRCDPITLPCYQCEQDCPDEQWLKSLLLGK